VTVKRAAWRLGLGWTLCSLLALTIFAGRSRVLLADGKALALDLAANPATSATSTPIAQAVLLLDLVPSGHAILDRAQKLWGVTERGDLMKFLKPGRASRTDAVLTRHFNPTTQEEHRSREVTIYLREGATLGDTVLDLAHELVHACARPAWDPYDPTLTAARYIQTAIEGEGGEVAAVVHECKVAREIAHVKPQLLGAAAQARCAAYWAAGEKAETQTIQKDFYRVGRWYETIRTRLGRDSSQFPMLSGAAPRLYSSTGASPYPVALYEEFQEMTRVACANTRTRLERSPAGVAAAPTVAQATASESTDRFLAQRCR
jgi:hypothetical protein